MTNNFILKLLPDIEAEYPAVSSVLFISVSTILILCQFENRDKLEKIEELLSKETSSIVGYYGSVKFFKNISEVDNCITKRIFQAKETVYNLNWQDFMAKEMRPIKSMQAIRLIRKSENFVIIKKI